MTTACVGYTTPSAWRVTQYLKTRACRVQASCPSRGCPALPLGQLGSTTRFARCVPSPVSRQTSWSDRGAPARGLGTAAESMSTQASVGASCEGLHPDREYVFEHGRVYIEDTDCFQVVFYANYFKYFLRAFEQSMMTAVKQAYREQGVHLRAVRVDNAKYMLAAVLGDNVVVRQSLLHVDDAAGTMTWAVAAHRVPESDVGSDGAAGAAEEQVLVSAEMTIELSTHAGGSIHALEGLQWEGDPPQHEEASTGAAGASAASARDSTAGLPAYDRAPVATTPITVFQDEVTRLGAPSELAVLRYFERSRSDCLKGSFGLRQLQESGVNVVVARINDLEIAVGDEGIGASGGKLEVRTAVEVQRRNTSLVFEQMLMCGDRVLARGKVLCVCIKQDTFRITPCPEAVLQYLTPAPSA